MAFFSICIPTHNRLDTLELAIRTVMDQSFHDFEIIVSDNASDVPVADLIGKYNDLRIRYFRHESIIDANDNWEFALQKAEGDFAILLADDDGLVISALERVYEIIQKTHAKVVQASHIRYAHPKTASANLQVNYSQKVVANSLIDSSYTNKLYKLDAVTFVKQILNGWGIGSAKVKHNWFPSCHPSGLFMAKSLIKDVVGKTGRITAKPFADVGFLSAILLAKDFYYIDSPLAIVGVDVGREVNGPLKGRRRYYDKLNTLIMFSPFKATTFNSMAVEAHLKVLNANKELFSTFDETLADHFFVKHVMEIIQDDIWDKRTLVDLGEFFYSIKGLELKRQVTIVLRLIKYLSIETKQDVSLLVRRHRRIRVEMACPFISGDEYGFENIVQCSSFIDLKYLPKGVALLESCL